MLIGLLLWPVSLHICNGIAWLSGRLARIMLNPAKQSEEQIEAPVENLVEEAPEATEDTSETSPEHAEAEAAEIDSEADDSLD